MRTTLIILSFSFVNNLFGQFGSSGNILFSHTGDTIVLNHYYTDSTGAGYNYWQIKARSYQSDTMVLLSKWKTKATKMTDLGNPIPNDTVIKYGLTNKGKTIDGFKIKDFRIDVKEKQTQKSKNDENLGMTSCKIDVSLYYKERLVSTIKNFKALYFNDKIETDDTVSLYGWKMDNKEKYIISSVRLKQI